MYIANGMVYGGKPIEPIRIVNVKPLDDSIMILTFSSGEKRLFDASILCGPVYEPLKQKEVFFSAEVDHGVVTWQNGDIDCAPEFMYDNSYEYEIAAV